MNGLLKTAVVFTSLALTAGCASTPASQAFAHHFDSAEEHREHSKCMSDNAIFNNRQLMMAPSAVESAWARCMRETDAGYPDREGAVTRAVTWQPSTPAR